MKLFKSKNKRDYDTFDNSKNLYTSTEDGSAGITNRKPLLVFLLIISFLIIGISVSVLYPRFIYTTEVTEEESIDFDAVDEDGYIAISPKGHEKVVNYAYENIVKILSNIETDMNTPLNILDTNQKLYLMVEIFDKNELEDYEKPDKLIRYNLITISQSLAYMTGSFATNERRSQEDLIKNLKIIRDSEALILETISKEYNHTK